MPCGPFANESERTAIEALRGRLKGLPGEGRWVALSNLAFAANAHFQPDEIDIVVIGPPGVFVVEVKHWDRGVIKNQPLMVDSEADRLTAKVRRLAGKLRQTMPKLGRVDGKMMLTRETRSFGTSTRPQHRGIALFTSSEWRDMLDVDCARQLRPDEVDLLCKSLEPRAKVSLSGDLRRLGDFIDLELRTLPTERFHRIYHGRHARAQERIILHLYDLSAADDAKARDRAMREFEVLQRLQKSPFLPRFRDSFQDVPGYPGELWFFTVVDPVAPSIEKRSDDSTWTVSDRLQFAARTLRALNELHHAGRDNATPLVHRNISPKSVLVTAVNQPLFADLSLARIPNAETVSNIAHSFAGREAFTAPEVLVGGLSVADQRSDVFALCASLVTLFEPSSDSLALAATTLLREAMVAAADQRSALNDVAERLDGLTSSSLRPTEAVLVVPALPPARYWSEDVIVPFNGRHYQIIERLGSGGIGITFKVIEVDRTTGENFGTYVGKVIPDRDVGDAAIRAYQRVKSHTAHTNLSVIFDYALEWRAESFVALLKWVEGQPLLNLSGLLEIVAEDCGDDSVEALALRWARDLCVGLASLHSANLVHGDVSPSNVIVHGGNVTLTDFDMVTTVGERARGAGNILFSAPATQNRYPLSCSDDVFSLAACIFKIVFDRDPFPLTRGAPNKLGGVDWQSDDRERYPRLAAFVDVATASDASKRFGSAAAAITWIDRPIARFSASAGEHGATDADVCATPNEVGWLKAILQTYPGSRFGNAETRGLDSDFAIATYVETGLEQALLDDLQGRRVRLVILCGNAGDGKTALLQHLAAQLGVDRRKSSMRTWEARTPSGLLLRANLDGSASYAGQSADDLLDDFFSPFLDGPPTGDIAHLLAINDGRLIEWIEGHQQRFNRNTHLGEQLSELLDQGTSAELDPNIRFINLNLRSLVGGIQPGGREIASDFLDQLLEKLVGGSDAATIWAPCNTCSAADRCQARRSAQLLMAGDSSVEARRFRERLSEMLQAVHQRGDVHITARELRAALSYVLFGVHYCADLHETPSLRPPEPSELAFDPDSPLRQGDVLREFTYLDPALESHPLVDRYLQGHGRSAALDAAPRFSGLPLGSARRRAYFEWTERQVAEVALDSRALGLARGRHLAEFRQVVVMSIEERARLCAEICGGISRLEDLPTVALQRPGVVPLKVTPRTPTESVFWVEKDLARLRLEPEQLHAAPGLAMLPRRLVLTYAARVGGEQTLTMGYELFHTLMELKDGYQLSDAVSDDLFANLAVFTQRLAQEDERELFAWNPQEERVVFKIHIDTVDIAQRISCTRLDGGVP